MFQLYSDYSVEIEEEVLDAKVGYGWFEGFNRRALVIAHHANGRLRDMEYPTDDETIANAPQLDYEHRK